MIFRRILILSLLLFAEIAKANDTVLITAFEPFGGRTVNNSALVAQKIADAKAELGPNIDVQVCIIPVVYDKGAEAAEGCYQKLKKRPIAVLSIGETGDCKVNLETRPVNLDNTPGFADNAQQIRENKIIDPDQPDAIGFNFPVYKMYCALSEDERNKIQVSNSLGNYVCNNTAFNLTEFFKKQNQKSYEDVVHAFQSLITKKKSHIPYAFVHVPIESCDGNQDPTSDDAKMMVKMLKSVIDSERATPAKTKLPTCLNDNRLPIDIHAVQKLENEILKEKLPECDAEFMQRLEVRYGTSS